MTILFLSSSPRQATPATPLPLGEGLGVRGKVSSNPETLFLFLCVGNLIARVLALSERHWF
jgi:hypothetical protein